MILWNIDTLDWKTKNTAATIDTVLKTADEGDILLLHDIHSSSVDAALALIPKLIDAGYQLVTVSEMADARGVQLQSGGVYTDFNKEQQLVKNGRIFRSFITDDGSSPVFLLFLFSKGSAVLFKKNVDFLCGIQYSPYGNVMI